MASIDDERTRQGFARLHEIHGDRGVETVESLGELGRHIAEFAYGEIYARPGLSLRERQLVTVGMLTAVGAAAAQLQAHLRASLAAGISIEEIREVIIHTVPYAGFPNAMNAWARFDDVLEEDDAAG
ncbi:MAG: carboxymuconolactone decarboxylase family protein [Actinomycetota bacterium]